MSHQAYYAAVKADDRFSKELIRVYGKRRAQDMRYRSSQWTDRKLKAVALLKQRADRKLAKAMGNPWPKPIRRKNPARRRKNPSKHLSGYWIEINGVRKIFFTDRPKAIEYARAYAKSHPTVTVKVFYVRS